MCQQPEAPTVAIEEIERQAEREEWSLSPDLLQSCAMPTMDAQSLEDVIKQTQGNLEYFRLVCGRLNLLIDKVNKSKPKRSVEIPSYLMAVSMCTQANEAELIP